MAASQVPPLIGRGYETGLLASLVEGVRDGGGAVVVRGEPGIGKSALLRATSQIAAAGGVRALTAAGVQSEAQIAFAGLHQLLRPVLEHLGQLPDIQRAAVLSAFGETDAVAPDPVVIALATLNLLGEAATRAPVLLIAEDAQWLDRASVDVLAFVARRLDFEPIILLAAMRDGFPSSLNDAGLRELNLGRLDPAASIALLDARTPGLQPQVREQVLREAAGNPLALVELPRVVEHAGRPSASTSWLPLTTRLEQAFAARVSGLPTAARTPLLVAALNDGESLSEALAVASVLGGGNLTVDDVVPAIDVRLVEVDEDALRFRHPLMRSAIHCLPAGVRQRPPRDDGRAAGRRPTARHVQRPSRALWCARLEEPPQLVSGRHRGPDPATSCATGHGAAGSQPHHVLLLASDRAANMTGADVATDGGLITTL